MPRGASMTPTPCSLAGRAFTRISVLQMSRSPSNCSDAFERVHDFDEPRPVVVKRTVPWRSTRRAPFFQFVVRQGSGNVIGDVEARERPDAIHAVRVAQRLDEWEFQVRPVFGRFGDHIEIAGRVDLVFENVALRVAEPEFPVVMFERAVRLHQPHEVGVETGEFLDLLLMVRLIFLQQVEREPGVLQRPRAGRRAFRRVPRPSAPCSHHRARENPHGSCVRP